MTAQILISAVMMLALGAGIAAAQGLPARIHDRITTFAGDPARGIAASEDPKAVFTLHSAHKEAGRPWADAIWVRRAETGVSYLSRAYDCAAGTYRWLGEAREIGRISLSVTSVEQTAPRRLVPGTIEYQLARHACAL